MSRLVELVDGLPLPGGRRPSGYPDEVLRQVAPVAARAARELLGGEVLLDDDERYALARLAAIRCDTTTADAVLEALPALIGEVLREWQRRR